MSTIEATADNFNSLIENHDIVVIDFWAGWCGPCKAFAPVFEAASNKHADVAFAKVDTEAQPELAGAFGVRAIPTLVVFRGKILLFEQAGAVPAAALEELLGQVRALDMDKVRADVEAAQAAEAKGSGGDA